MPSPPAALIAAAQHAEAVYGVPACTELAQCWIESQYGAHEPAGSNDAFGIKAGAGQPYVLARTREVIGGRSVYVMAKFRKFASEDEGFIQHDRLIATNPIYARAMSLLPDIHAFVVEMGRHYATAPNYASAVLATIAAQNLRQYDKRPWVYSSPAQRSLHMGRVAHHPTFVPHHTASRRVAGHR